MNRQLAALVAFLLLIPGVATLHWVVGGLFAGAVDDCTSLARYQGEAEERGDNALAVWLQQELNTCEGNPANTGANDDPNANTGNGDGNGDDDGNGGNDAAANVCEVTYLADFPPVEERWTNSYAPDDVARHPDFAGKAMSDLTVEQALLEGEHRRSFDPMLTYADGVAFGVLPGTNDAAAQAQAIKSLAADCDKWQRVNAEIERIMREDYAHRVETFAPGTYQATFALSGNAPGEVPMVLSDDDVDRESAFTVLVSTRKSDGKTVNRRLECGFQVYSSPREEQPAPVVVHEPVDDQPNDAPAPVTHERIVEREDRVVEIVEIVHVPMPEPSPGMDQNEERVPERDEDEPVSCPDGSRPDEHGECPSEEPQGPPPGDEPPPNDEEEPPPADDAKDPSLDPEPRGNNREGGGGQAPPVTEDASPPAAGQPEDEYVAPAPPSGGNGDTDNSSDGGSSEDTGPREEPAGEPVTGAPNEDQAPVEGCVSAPGSNTCG